MFILFKICWKICPLEPEDKSDEDGGEQTPEEEDEIIDSLSQVKLEGEEPQEGGDDVVDEQPEGTDTISNVTW